MFKNRRMGRNGQEEPFDLHALTEIAEAQREERDALFYAECLNCLNRRGNASGEGMRYCLGCAISDWSDYKPNRKITSPIFDCSPPPPKERQAYYPSSPLKDKVVAFSGTLEHLTRIEAKNVAEKSGARVSGSVSARADFLVAGPGAGPRVDKATELGVQILTEGEFIAMAGWAS